MGPGTVPPGGLGSLTFQFPEFLLMPRVIKRTKRAKQGQGAVAVCNATRQRAFRALARQRAALVPAFVSGKWSLYRPVDVALPSVATATYPLEGTVVTKLGGWG